MRRGDLGSFAEVEWSVESGGALLWIAAENNRIEAAAVTELRRTELSRSCVIVACGGRGDWASLIGPIENYARAEGCDCVRLFGRKGWGRVLPDYAATKIVLEKRLS